MSMIRYLHHNKIFTRVFKKFFQTLPSRMWTPSAKSRRMKKEVISQGLHWDTTQQKSGKVEFTDLLFTPKTVSSSLPILANKPKPASSSTKSIKSAATTSTGTTSTRGPRSSKRSKIRAIEDYSTGLWVHNGLTAREKAAACIEMSNSYANKTWMSKFRIAMSVNESTLKRKLKEGTPMSPAVRNEQGAAYKKQFFNSPQPKVRSSDFTAKWANSVDTKEAHLRKESAAFRNKGLTLIREKSTGPPSISASA